jgi:hypothetical protein
MGIMTAKDLQWQGLNLEQQIAIHFTSNCYPPIPHQMIPTAVEAIHAYHDEELDKLIPLPEGVSFRGNTEVAARDVINSYYLGAWCESEMEDEEN